MHAPIPVLPERRARPRTDRRTESFLVRTWREGEQGDAIRFFVRNLRTGEESYLPGPEALAHFVSTRTGPEPES